MAATNKPATDIAYLCRALKAPSLAKAIDRLAERARAESWTHEEFLAACLEREVAARQSNGGELRIRAARFPARKTLEDFDFDHQRSLKRDVIAHLGALDFVDARDNVVFLGPPGTGKTHLAIGLSIRACQAGHRVAFATAAEWVDRFAAAHDTGRLHNELRRHGRYPLLVIDEVGYIPFETDAANLFWPDLEERAAANNLRVTMTYLLRVLEPARSAGEPAYHIRVDGQAVTLVTSDWLRIDADRFNEHVTRAARAESDGTPSLALEHNLAAVALYRGETHEGVADADWIALEREHFRVRLVAAATRAGELLVARGDVDEAERVARRAIEVDPWAEDAYAVLVSVALARRDRSAARRTLDRGLAALTDLGVEPSEDTRRLRRRLRGGPGDTD
jgi:DNA replication protein DnaC